MLMRTIVVALLLGIPSVHWGAESQRWALLIGVDEYSELQGLSYAGKDMQALAEQLQASGFEAERTVLMHDATKERRFLPIRSNIERELELMLRRVRKDDTLLIAFSGHGLYLDGKSYFCPTEARVTEPEKTLISIDAVYKQLETCPAALKIMLVDACRNDPRPAGRKSATPKDDLQKLGATFERPPEGLLVYSSCGPGQISWEDETLNGGHGVFMNYFLQGLTGDADSDKNGKISLQELFDFSCDKTESFVATRRSDFQRPAWNGRINGKFEFLPSFQKTMENSIGMKLVAIPAGEFVMGNEDTVAELLKLFPYGKQEWFEDAVETHRVRLTKSFYLGEREVTVGQFRAFVTATKHKSEAETDGKGGYGFDESKGTFAQDAKYSWRNPGFAQGDDHPVVNVTWNDAAAFCAWLSRKEGKTYRLPTEAEWEYACRGGTQTRYSFGNDPEGLIRIGNTFDARAKAKLPSGTNPLLGDDGHVFTAPGGSYRANPLGLYDMHGNVCEWCSDWYGNYPTSGATDPQGPSEGSFRVNRGGGWSLHAADCRSAFRHGFTPDFRSFDLGFRVALVPSGK